MMMREVFALVRFKDGTGQIARYKLETGLSFAKSEMRRWIKEQSKKPVKSVKFIALEEKP